MTKIGFLKKLILASTIIEAIEEYEAGGIDMKEGLAIMKDLTTSLGVAYDNIGINFALSLVTQVMEAVVSKNISAEAWNAIGVFVAKKFGVTFAGKPVA